MTARLLTMDEAAERLNVKKSWLRDQVTARTVPFTFIGKGRLVRFTEEHLDQIIAAGEQAPVGAQAPLQSLAGTRARRSPKPARKTTRSAA